MLASLTQILILAFCNRARGSQLFGLTTSTTIGRLVSTALMAITAGLLVRPVLIPILWTGLYLWTLPAWDKYWSAAIGNPTDMTVPSFAPVDWIMKLWPSPKPGIELRLWGAIAMGLRGGLLLYPLFAVLGFMGYPLAFTIGLATFLQGVPYLIAGIPNNKAYSIPFAELLWGACLGIIFLGAFNA